MKSERKLREDAARARALGDNLSLASDREVAAEYADELDKEAEILYRRKRSGHVASR